MKVLVIVDMQNDFISGSLGSKEAESIVENVVNKISQCDENTTVLFTKDTHQKNYLETHEGKSLPVEHCIYGTDGWGIDDRIIGAFNDNKQIKNKLVYSVHLKDAFGCLSLAHEIERYTHCVESIEVCGLCSEICVVSNALLLKAYMPEVPMIVDASCCAGVTVEKHNAAMDVMESCQINVINRG